MSRFVDMTGMTFGRLTVVSFSRRRGHNSIWVCKCSCGKLSAVSRTNLVTGNTSSCGCLRAEVSGNARRRHGLTETPTWYSWAGMMDRCYDRSTNSYRHYGARGIKVCERWHTFEHFLADMGARPPGKYSIDRIDNGGNYEPSNCRWATIKEQARNMRTNRVVVFNGKKMCLVAACESAGINSQTVRSRMMRGWNFNDAVTTPLLRKSA